MNITQVLVRAWADRDAVDSEGRTPLDYASLLEDGESMVALLQQATLTDTPANYDSKLVYTINSDWVIFA